MGDGKPHAMAECLGVGASVGGEPDRHDANPGQVQSSEILSQCVRIDPRRAHHQKGSVGPPPHADIGEF